MGTLKSMVLSPPVYHDVCLRIHKASIERLDLQTSSSFADMQQIHDIKAGIMSRRSQG